LPSAATFSWLAASVMTARDNLAADAAWPQEQPQLSRDDHDRPRLVHLPGMPGHDAL
jgi:hypothetical protein